MKFNKNDILKSFEGFDPRTIDNLDIILKQVKKQGKEISEYALVVFQMLAVQYDLFYTAYDSLNSCKDIVNVCQLGERTIHATKPQVEVLLKANTQISKYLKDLGLSPLESAKIKKLNSADSEKLAEEAYEDLLS